MALLRSTYITRARALEALRQGAESLGHQAPVAINRWTLPGLRQEVEYICPLCKESVYMNHWASGTYQIVPSTTFQETCKGIRMTQLAVWGDE